MLRTLPLFVALCSGPSSGLGQVHSADAPKAEAPAPQPTVAVKETPPVRIAFVEHQGAYWTLGPVFEMVRESMSKMNEDGPMFVRYHGDPRKVSAAELTSDVGFVVDGGGDPAPLTIDRRPAEKVAYLLAPGPHGTTARFYGMLYDWAKQNGYEAKGGPVEIYWGREGKDVVEIQLPIAEAPPAAPDARESKSVPEQGAAQEAGAADAEVPEQSAATDAPATTQQTASGPLDAGPDDQATGAAEQPEAAPASDAIAFQFGERKFEALAADILPDGLSLDAESEVWVGQIGYRLLAVGRGMRQKFGEEADAAQMAGEALLARWRSLLPPGVDPLALASRASSGSSHPQHKEILRRADLLLGRIALGATDFQAATKEVVEMLQDIRRVLRAKD